MENFLANNAPRDTRRRLRLSIGAVVLSLTGVLGLTSSSHNALALTDAMRSGMLNAQLPAILKPAAFLALC